MLARLLRFAIFAAVAGGLGHLLRIAWQRVRALGSLENWGPQARRDAHLSAALDLRRRLNRLSDRWPPQESDELKAEVRDAVRAIADLGALRLDLEAHLQGLTSGETVARLQTRAERLNQAQIEALEDLRRVYVDLLDALGVSETLAAARDQLSELRARAAAEVIAREELSALLHEGGPIS